MEKASAKANAKKTKSNDRDSVSLTKWVLLGFSAFLILIGIVAVPILIANSAPTQSASARKPATPAVPSAAIIEEPSIKEMLEEDSKELVRARLYNRHGLKDKAKAECVSIVTSNSSNSEKATAYYLLGLIAFEENRTSTAFNTWRQLSDTFPNSKEALDVQGKIADLAQIVGEGGKENLENAMASSYLRHADFWSKGKSTIFSIDSSWIPQLDAALKWYDKTIEEFPNSTAARLAYEKKMKAIIGWEEIGQYGSSHGIKKDPKKYLPLLESTLGAYQSAFPNAGSLQAFRFQVAQEYWKIEDWANCRKWLNDVVKNGSNNSFYTDLAKRRLAKVEH